MDVVQSIFRWFHIVAGIVWIGHLYFFNFVNAPFQGTIDGDTKKKVNPELLPRALFWFRWGAAWTWIFGVLLLMIVFYMGGAMFEGQGGFGFASLVMIALTFLAFLIYDAAAEQPFAKDAKIFAAAGFILIAIFVFLFSWVPNISYRGLVIHTGAMFGTIMAANVWMRIWPAQQKIISAVKAGSPPEPTLVARAGTRSKHNTYLSVPLVWMMIDEHTSITRFNTSGLQNPLLLLVMVGIGWGLVWLFYRKAPQVKGF